MKAFRACCTSSGLLHARALFEGPCCIRRRAHSRTADALPFHSRAHVQAWTRSDTLGHARTRTRVHTHARTRARARAHAHALTLTLTLTLTRVRTCVRTRACSRPRTCSPYAHCFLSLPRTHVHSLLSPTHPPLLIALGLGQGMPLFHRSSCLLLGPVIRMLGRDPIPRANSSVANEGFGGAVHEVWFSMRDACVVWTYRRRERVGSRRLWKGSREY